MKRFLRRNALLIATAGSVVVGIAAGVVCRQLQPSKDVILLVGFPGELLMRMLKMLMLPLIIASIITGVGSLQGSTTGRMGVVAMLYYMSTTLMALLVALLLGLTIKPGQHSGHAAEDAGKAHQARVSAIDVLMDLFRNMVPDNIVGATIHTTRTVHSYENMVTETGANSTDVQMVVKKIDRLYGANIIGVLLYSVVFGLILSRLGKKVEVVAIFFSGINNITLKMITIVMWYSPIGIAFLIASQVMASEDLSKTGHILSWYMCTELACLAIHFLCTLPMFYFILTRQNPFRIYLGAVQSLLTAFATCSSAASLPVTMQCLENKLKMNERVVGFVLPIGATVNMDGGAVLGTLAPLFIAQYNNITLSVGDVLIISLTSMLSSVGAAAVPSSGLALLLLVLKAIGLPDHGFAFIITLDWLIDRFRTVLNVASDCLAVGVTSKYTDLDPSEERTTPTSPDTRPLCGDSSVQLDIIKTLNGTQEV